MTHNDKQPVNGQDNPNFLDLFNQLPPVPPAPELDGQHGTGRFGWLRAAWKTSWKEGGFLYERWEEVGQARHVSWHEAANWIKATLLFGGLSLIVLMLDAAGDITSATLKALSDVPATSAGGGSGLWGTVDHPIRVFLADQAAHLPVAPAALYAFWQLTGLLGLVGGFFGNAGARIAWLLFGIGSLAMIWSATPAGGRAAATGLAALMWALASIFALRGLSLRPIVHNHPPQFQPQFSPALHIHATLPAPTPAGDDFGDEPDNVHPLQR
ncbi:hypothetical protein STHAL_33240 [Streptomyces halstedii]|uniref:YIP1 family protein n=1 Tax=Streptomyces halstedii TaxID=1944 RepID=A0ABS6U195_STRHA|nr:hypothetical protein [Streptomyces halstedii]MBV7674313.1 hypothetical protein [Streptomyces halstedii]